MRLHPISRREAMRDGLFGAAGLFIGSHLGASLGRAAVTDQPFTPGKAKSVIQIWMWGGPAHIDTFDPKPEAAANFAFYPLRRLDAEVLIDALCQISGLGESYTSSIPEPVTFMPDNQRAIGLPDGSIGSAFLELFGRPPRDTGLASERNNRLTDAQRLDLLNSTQIQRKIQQGPKLLALMRDFRNNRELVDQLYLTVLSRKPTDDEWKQIVAHSQSGAARGQQAFVDLAWALVNSSEFLYRH